jgi:hemolysin activation/secretion protein
MPPRASALARGTHRSAARAAEWHALLWLALLATSLAPTGATGQAIDRPADERPELPDFVGPEPAPILPPIPPPETPREQLATGPGVYVEGFRITGGTVFTAEELQQALAPWSGRRIRSEDLVSVRNAVTRLYVDSGYVNSGARIPDQEADDGIVEVRIVEGVLAEIRFSGNEQFRDGYLRGRIERGAGTPLNVRPLEEQLRMLQQDPRIERLAARLAPGDRPGEAVLYVEVEEANRLRADLSVSNYEPPSIGDVAGQIEAAVANPAGWGDTLSGSFTASGGLLRGRGYYEIPVTRWGTLFTLEARYSSAKVVESPFDDLDIKSDFQSYRIGFQQPVYATPQTLITTGVLGDWRRTNTKLLGNPFSFPGSGAQDGQSTATVLRFFAEWLRRDQRQVFAARSQVSWGIDALGATINSGDEPDGRFVSWLLQLQWARRFGYGIETVFRGDLQLTSDPLLTMEQIAVGGYATVRGYRQNQRVQDQGAIGSVEVRVPIWRQPRGLGVIQLAPFVDVGYAFDHSDRELTREKVLASMGIGLRWSFMRFFSARIYWGHQFNDVQTSGTLQDDGVQLLLTASFP